MSARKVLPTSDYEGLHVVKLSYAVACGETRLVAIDILLISKRFVSKKATLRSISISGGSSSSSGASNIFLANTDI